MERAPPLEKQEIIICSVRASIRSEVEEDEENLYVNKQ